MYKQMFKKFIRIKPPSSKKKSVEQFYLGTGYKRNIVYQNLIECDPEAITFDELYEKLVSDSDKGIKSFSSNNPHEFRNVIKKSLALMESSKFESK